MWKKSKLKSNIFNSLVLKQGLFGTAPNVSSSYIAATLTALQLLKETSGGTSIQAALAMGDLSFGQQDKHHFV